MNSARHSALCHFCPLKTPLTAAISVGGITSLRGLADHLALSIPAPGWLRVRSLDAYDRRLVAWLELVCLQNQARLIA